MGEAEWLLRARAVFVELDPALVAPWFQGEDERSDDAVLLLLLMWAGGRVRLVAGTEVDRRTSVGRVRSLEVRAHFWSLLLLPLPPTLAPVV